MSEIVRREGNRNLAHIVKNKEKYYYVDSVLVGSHYFETMVFPFDIEQNDVINYNDLYCERYDNAVKMVAKHNEIINNLEKFIKEE